MSSVKELKAQEGRHDDGGIHKEEPQSNEDSSKRIKGMEGNGFYNKNSRAQSAASNFGVPVWREAIRQVLGDSHQLAFTHAQLQHLHIADYGSSQGKNSVQIIKIALELIPANSSVVVTHVDLPTNDFNSLIQVTADEQDGYSKTDKHQVFVSARGRSFYEKCFPDASVHFGWSAFATHWLSEVPSTPLNHFVVHRATNPEKEIWVERARQDWHTFVKFRGQELVSGGRYVQVGITRDDDGTTGSEGVWDLLELALKPALTKKQYDALRLPVYHRSHDEWLEPFAAEPDVWTIKHVSFKSAQNPFFDEYEKDHDLDKLTESVTGVVRAAYFAGLFRDENTAGHLEEITNRFRTHFKNNPFYYGAMNWRLIILDVERR